MTTSPPAPISSPAFTTGSGDASLGETPFTTGFHQNSETLPYAQARARARGAALLVTAFVVGLIVLRLAGDSMALALTGGGLTTVALLGGAITASVWTDR